MSLDAVIFDCDGTLVDSESLSNEVFAEALSAHGFPLTGREAMERFRGLELAACLREIEAALGRKLPAHFAIELRRRTAAIFRERLRPVDGAMELVQGLALPKCVASSGPREKIELSLSLTGLLAFFEGRIFSCYEIGAWKPDPDIFLHAAARLGVPPGRCAVVEDSLPGIRAGLAAGMRVFAFQPDAVDPRIPEGVPVIRRLAQLRDALA
ncbi:HAD family hydrolase [Frateuria sp. Soil773]|uniref:HAD family hydrolase n=1 Tax=Frateuria sp. Soil773 TaxID=1736407 RepID=UPI001911081C|nr:HAD family hydrolase [Frateuria sp. Soil773]